MRKAEYVIRPALKDEWEETMALAWRTFMKFEACDYTEEGIKSFSDFISDNGLYKMFMIDEYLVWVALDGEKIVGMISLRSRTHISLLFVDAAYHKRGIATALMQELWTHIKKQGGNLCTVNSSPYAVGFYHKLGFRDRAGEQEEDGIRYTPMMIRF